MGEPVDFGGPERCPKPCTECPDGTHHFSDAMITFADDEPHHRAALAGYDYWLICKHCDAWRTYDPDAEDDLDEDSDDMENDDE